MGLRGGGGTARTVEKADFLPLRPWKGSPSACDPTNPSPCCPGTEGPSGRKSCPCGSRVERLWASRIVTASLLPEQKKPTGGRGPLGVPEWPTQNCFPPWFPAASPHQRLSLLRYSPGPGCSPRSTGTGVHSSPGSFHLGSLAHQKLLSLCARFYFQIYLFPSSSPNSSAGTAFPSGCPGQKPWDQPGRLCLSHPHPVGVFTT